MSITTGHATALIDDERISSYGRLLEAQRRLHRIFDQSLRSEAGITIVWYDALLRLGRSADRQMPITELGDQLVLTSGGATRLVDRLEENGYVERVSCRSDRRVQWARLTEMGFKVLEEATAIHLRDLDEHFSGHLSQPEMKTLSGLLDRFRLPPA